MIKQCFSPCLLHLTGIPHLLPQFDTVQLHHISRRPVPPSIYSLVFLPRTALHSPEPCARCCCRTGWGSLLCKADRAEEKAQVKSQRKQAASQKPGEAYIQDKSSNAVD